MGWSFESILTRLILLCPICCFVLNLVFWNLQVPLKLQVCNFAVLPCVKSSVAQLRKCSPSWEAANMFFSVYVLHLLWFTNEEAWFLLWQCPDGSLCIWMSSVSSLSLLLPLGPWFWYKVSTHMNIYGMFAFDSFVCHY